MSKSTEKGRTANKRASTSPVPTSVRIKGQLQAQAAGILAEGLILESFNHPGIRGIEREEPIRRFLRNHLPGKFHVAQGSIASSERILNRQHDIVVADRDVCFTLLNTIGAQLMAVESVHLIVEVRSQDNELDDVATSLRAVRGLRAEASLLQRHAHTDMGTTGPAVHTVVIYNGPKKPKTMMDALAKANGPDTAKDSRMAIDFVLVLSSTPNPTPASGYLIGYSRPGFSQHYYPKAGEKGLSGPKVIHKGPDSFAYWYAGILNHLSGVIAFPPILYRYLGDKVFFGPWTDKPH